MHAYGQIPLFRGVSVEPLQRRGCWGSCFLCGYRLSRSTEGGEYLVFSSIRTPTPPPQLLFFAENGPLPVVRMMQEDTDWAGGLYKVTMEFTEDYPSKVGSSVPAIFCVLWAVLSCPSTSVRVATGTHFVSQWMVDGCCSRAFFALVGDVAWTCDQTACRFTTVSLSFSFLFEEREVNDLLRYAFFVNLYSRV